MNDIEAKREQRKRERDRRHSERDPPDVTLKLWVDHDMNVVCREITGRRDIASTGKDRADVVRALIKGAGQVGILLSDSGPEDGVSDAWMSETVMTASITRCGAQGTIHHQWLTSESKPGIRHRLGAARWMLRQTWVVFGPMLRCAFDMVFRPSRLRNLPLK